MKMFFFRADAVTSGKASVGLGRKVAPRVLLEFIPPVPLTPGPEEAPSAFRVRVALKKSVRGKPLPFRFLAVPQDTPSTISLPDS